MTLGRSLATSTPGPIFRLGQVLCWVGIIVAAPAAIIAAGALYSLLFIGTEPNAGLTLMLSLFWAVPSYAIGRMLRYVLAGY